MRFMQVEAIGDATAAIVPFCAIASILAPLLDMAEIPAGAVGGAGLVEHARIGIIATTVIAPIPINTYEVLGAVAIESAVRGTCVSVDAAFNATSGICPLASLALLGDHAVGPAIDIPRVTICAHVGIGTAAEIRPLPIVALLLLVAAIVGSAVDGLLLSRGAVGIWVDAGSAGFPCAVNAYDILFATIIVSAGDRIRIAVGTILGNTLTAAIVLPFPVDALACLCVLTICAACDDIGRSIRAPCVWLDARSIVLPFSIDAHAGLRAVVICSARDGIGASLCTVRLPASRVGIATG